MYNVLDICRYIINYSNEKEYGISNLKLQKILYFVQAYFLIMKDEKCFQERIEAWDFGPVVPIAYHEFKQYGSGNIPKIISYVKFNDENMWNIQRIEYDENIISQENRQLINEVVDKFSEYSATDLVTLTHKQAPWKDAYVPHKNKEITVEKIRGYFINE